MVLTKCKCVPGRVYAALQVSSRAGEEAEREEGKPERRRTIESLSYVYV